MISAITTEDGTTIVTDPETGRSASGANLAEAVREVKRQGRLTMTPGTKPRAIVAVGTPKRTIVASRPHGRVVVVRAK